MALGIKKRGMIGVLGLASGLAMTGCAPLNPLPPVALSQPAQAAAEAAIRDVLKDPESARFDGFKAGQDKDGSTLICGRVNAKNGFGGYGGRELFAVRVMPNGSASVEALQDQAYAMGWCHRHNLTP